MHVWRREGKLMGDHKKTVTSLSIPEFVDSLTMFLKRLASLGVKQQRILSDWLGLWSKYLTAESNFDPKRLIYYKRGDIVHANFGYNVGSELGGTHYAVVVENNNNISNGLVTVVPLSSLGTGKTKSDLHKAEIYLGKIVGDVECFAMPLQIRPISKIRIIKPMHKTDGKITLTGDLLDKIDEQIKIFFTKQK